MTRLIHAEDPLLMLNDNYRQRLYKNRYLNAVDKAAEQLAALAGSMDEYSTGRESMPINKYLMCLYESQLPKARTILSELHQVRQGIIKAEPDLDKHRTLTPPVLLFDILYGRLMTHIAVSVGKLDEDILEHLRIKILKYTPADQRQEQLEVLATLEDLLGDQSVRYRRWSGQSYQLYAYDQTATLVRRLNLNNMVILVGTKDYGAPTIERQRLRKQRNDADQRKIIASLFDHHFYRIN